MTSEVIDWAAQTFDSRPADQAGFYRRRDNMTDVTTIASRYIDLWNERTPSRRREILAAHWTDDATYIDPMMSGDGHDGVDALISGVQARFPDFRFQLIGQPNGFGDHVRFSWGLGPEGIDSPIKGTDFAVVRDGRIRSITGFLDQVPQDA
jgi:SnoaL-like domain